MGPTSTDGITTALAELVIETPPEDIPGKAYAAASVALLDALGCAFAGHNAPGVESVVALTQHWGGREEASLWFHGGRVPAPAAAFVNSTQLHAMDFDDYHPPSDAHITSVLVPAVLAVAEANDVSGRETLAALVLGVEVVGRIGRVCLARRDHPGFLPASVIGGFGAAAAACRLMRCTVEQTVNAMGIWYGHASGNRQALFDRTLTKRIQPAIAARAGVFAACLAARSFTGPSRIIGGQPASLTRIFGYTGRGKAPLPTVAEIMAARAAWAVEELLYKRFACCGVSNNAIRAATALAAEHDLDLEQIREVRIFGSCANSPFGGVAWDDSPIPHVLAQFCVPYATASALRNRRYGPAEISPEQIARDRQVDALARRTRLRDWTEWPGAVPDKAATTVQVFLADGRSLECSRSGDGCMRSPVDDAEIRAKFEANVTFSGLFDEQGASRAAQDIAGLENRGRISDFIRERLWFDVH